MAMILYTNSADRTVSLEVPVAAVPGTITVTIKRDGVAVYEVDTVTYTNGRYEFTLPFFLAQEDADLRVSWKFDYIENGQTYTYNRDSFVTVVTPYVPFSVLNDLYGVELSPEEILTAERAVRTVISAHTGQTFGRSTGVKTVRGNGENALVLPARLISFTDFTANQAGFDLYGNYEIDGDGWYLKPVSFGAAGYNIKADITDYVSVNGVIYSPYGRRVGTFPKEATYTIEGVWGYEEVPEPVVEAAKLLINDYAGPDSTYRDRYLESLTSPDWRIQFHSGAYQRTGNVRADQLLSDFVLKRGWAVI